MNVRGIGFTRFSQLFSWKCLLDSKCLVNTNSEKIVPDFAWSENWGSAEIFAPVSFFVRVPPYVMNFGGPTEIRSGFMNLFLWSRSRSFNKASTGIHFCSNTERKNTNYVSKIVIFAKIAIGGPPENLNWGSAEWSDQGTIYFLTSVTIDCGSHSSVIAVSK